MAEETDARKVRAAFEEACPGVRVDRMSPMAGGYTSAHWRFDTDEGPLLLKVPVRNSDPEHLRHLLVATRLAAEAGLPVVRFRSFVPHAHELGKPVLVLEFVDGEQASAAWTSLRAADRARISEEMGSLLGRLHAATGADRLTDALGGREVPSVAEEARNGLDEALGTLADVRIDGGWSRVRERVQKRVEDIGAVRPVLTHRDFYLDNVLVSGGSVRTVLDFEHARFSDQYSEFGKISELLFDWYPETRGPFLDGYRRWHEIDDGAWARIHAHCGLYNVVMCGYFARWEPELVPEYTTRIEQWLREDERRG